MLEYNSMIARFEDPQIIKLIADNNDPANLCIITLDSDGEEVINTIPKPFPVANVKLVNNSDVEEIPFEYGVMSEFGVIMKVASVKQDPITVPCMLGTPDGVNYVLPNTVNIAGVTFTVSDTVNCMEYDGFILMTDMDPDASRSCTITFTNE